MSNVRPQRNQIRCHPSSSPRLAQSSQAHEGATRRRAAPCSQSKRVLGHGAPSPPLPRWRQSEGSRTVPDSWGSNWATMRATSLSWKRSDVLLEVSNPMLVFPTTESSRVAELVAAERRTPPSGSEQLSSSWQGSRASLGSQTALRPNPSLERTSTGWARYARCSFSASRAQPVASAQLKR
jgi:hypothetical protein